MKYTTPAKPAKRPDTRGARNHNPLNIRIGNCWLGEALCPDESDFECFVSDFYGYRAAFLILRRYIRRYHKNTISRIVTTWSPPSENDTSLYITQVSTRTGIPPETLIDYADRESVCSIVRAMAYVESRLEPTMDELYKAYEAA